jgi:hypothetical protein
MGVTNKPKLEAAPPEPVYKKGTWDESAQGKAALDAYNAQRESVIGKYNPETGKYEGGYKNFDFGYDNWMNDVIAQIKLYPDFKYNFNEDALYQQYKDKYIQQGKLAMADTMGQAAAMTGGYGNSYAQSVGQQAYQAQLDNLNDIIPELYQMALDKHKMTKDDLYNQYGMLSSEYDRQYGQHQDEYNKLLDALGIAKSDYYDGGNMFYTQQNNFNDITSKEFNDAMAIVSENNTNAWKGAEWDEDIRRWGIEDARAARELAMKEEAWELEKATYELELKRQKNLPITPPSSNSLKDNKPAQVKKEALRPTAVSYDDITSDLNTFIKNKASKSEINSYLRQALKAGYIDNAQYNKLKDLYASRGYTY